MFGEACVTPSLTILLKMVLLQKQSLNYKHCLMHLMMKFEKHVSDQMASLS